MTDVEDELLAELPAGDCGNDVRNQFDTLMAVDAFSSDRYHAEYDDGEDLQQPQVSRTLNFQVSQSYQTFPDEAAAAQYFLQFPEKEASPVGGGVRLLADDNFNHYADGLDCGVESGMLMLPPMNSDSIMLRGDSGICRWSVVASARDKTAEDDHMGVVPLADGDASTASSMTIARMGKETIHLDRLLQDYYDHASERRQSRQTAEDTRRAKRVREDALSHSERAADDPRRSPGGFHAVVLSEDAVTSGGGSGNDTLWVSRYRPRAFKDLLSDEAANLRILQWMKSWDLYVFGDRGPQQVRHPNVTSTVVEVANKAGPSLGGKGAKKQQGATATASSSFTRGAQAVVPGRTAVDEATSSSSQRPEERLLLIVGPPGVGKTTLAHVIAEHCGYEAKEINASCDRTVSVMEAIINDAVANKAHSGGRATTGGAAATGGREEALLEKLLRPKCLIIDEMDGIQSNVVSLLLSKDIHRPVLCLANNLFAPALRELRSAQVTIIQIPPIVAQKLASRLEYIARCEHLQVDRGTLLELIHVSNGDVRCCLNTLQFLRRSPQSSDGGGGASTWELQKTLAQLRGKDATLGLWPLWTETFCRRERSKYVSLLRSEFHLDWEAMFSAEPDVASASAAAPPRKRHRIDPGYWYAWMKIGLCADPETYLDGLFEHYAQMRYSDYTFDKTVRGAETFAFYDRLTAHGYANNNVGFSEKFVPISGSACFLYCSSQSRASNLSFPREHSNFREQQQRGLEAARQFTSRLHGPQACMYASVDTVSLDVASLLTRSLLNRLIRFPAQAVSTSRVFGPVDRQLFADAVERFVEYGLTYVAPERGLSGTASRGGMFDQQRHWTLHPSLNSLGGLRDGYQERTAAAVGHFSMGAKHGSLSDRGSTSSATGHRMTQGGVGQSLPLVVVMKDDVKQLLAGEVNTLRIRRRLERAGVPARAAAAVGSGPPAAAPLHLTVHPGERTAKDSVAAAEVAPQQQGEHCVDKAAAQQSADSKIGGVVAPVACSSAAPSSAPQRKDFFGRRIAATAAAASPTKKAEPTPTKKGGALSGKRALPPTHIVKYVYYDGSTNAVKLPAVREDFL